MATFLLPMVHLPLHLDLSLKATALVLARIFNQANLTQKN